MSRNILVAFFSVFLFALNCSSLSRQDIPPADQRLVVEPLKVEMSYDVSFMRIDIIRQYTSQTTTTTDANGNTTQQTTYTPVPYHAVGVDLGNGLFLDANSNLSLLLLPTASDINANNYHIVFKSPGWFSSDTEYIRRGKQLTIDHGGLFGGSHTIDLLPDGAVIRGGTFTSDATVKVTDANVTYETTGLFGGKSAKLEKTDRGARIPGFWSDDEIEKISDDHVSIDEDLHIRRSGNELIVEIDGFFGSKDVIKVVRSKNRVIGYNEDMRGFRADITPQGVKILWVKGGIGTKEYEYVIQTPPN